MVAASAYVLIVPANRREVLLDHNDLVGAFGPALAEPVPRFKHSGRAPLIVFASFKKGYITHIADGRKGTSAGTRLVRLNLDNFEKLQQPIAFKKLIATVPAKFRSRLTTIFANGGMPPPKTMMALVEEVLRLAPDLKARLVRYSRERRARLAKLTSKQRSNLGAQKDTLTLSLEIAGLPKDEVLEWVPGETPTPLFLQGLESGIVREDVMLLKDFSTVPGFDAVNGATNVATKTFVDPVDRTRKLTVIMANELPLEEQTGADLVYYNEKYRAFVMVQYKAMEQRSGKSEFRWKAGDQLAIEIDRMDKILEELEKIAQDKEPDGYRFATNPFFLKFCSRMVFNPDDKGLFPGMYLPLDLWKSLAASGKLVGPQRGNVLTFDNVGRKLANDEFVPLVANAWVGTSIAQSAVLERVVRAILESGRTVTFAVKHNPDPDPSPVPVDVTQPIRPRQERSLPQEHVRVRVTKG